MRATAVLSLFLLASPAAAAIRGRVVGAGQPVANARITVHPVETFSELIVAPLANRKRPVLATATSAADGAFTLQVEGAGSVIVHVEAAGFATSFSEEAIGDTDVIISLSSAKRREFTLRSAAGALAGARVIQMVEGGIIETSTNDRGRVALDPTGPIAMLLVHPRAALHVVLAQPQGDAIHIETAFPLKGKVVDGNSRGVAGARVSIDNVPIAVSSDDGTFVVERAPSQYRELTAEVGDLAGSAAGSTTIRVAPRHLVSGVVRDAERRPLRGISVTLASDAGDELAVSDEKGAYALRVADGTYTVSSSSVAYRFDDEKFDVRKSVVKDLVAKRTPMLSGVVANTQDGSTVAGAQILVAIQRGTNEETPGFEGLTDMAPTGTRWSGPDGRFRIASFPFELEQTMRLVAYKRGLPPGASADIQHGKTMRGRDPDIIVSKGIEVSGIVRDTAGRPVAGVDITPTRHDLVLLGRLADPPRTDRDGRFSLPLSDGTWTLAFAKEGYLANAIPELKVHGAIKPLEVTLESTVEIRGRVVRKDGSGVANVMIGEEGVTPTETSADGSFVLPAVRAGAHVLQYFTEGGAHGELRVTAPAADARIVLDDTGVLRGRVVDAAGAPVPSFEISVKRGPEDFGMPKQFADAEGRFVWNDAPVGDATVSAKSSGFIAATRSVVIEAGKTTEEITLTLRRGRTVRGKVVSASGDALAGVRVGVAPSQEQTESGSDGTYEVNGLDATQLMLLFTKNGFVRVVRQVPNGNDDVTLNVQLPAGLVLTGHVVKPNGDPIANATVVATSAAAGAESANAQTDEQGAFRLEGLAPARYDLTAGESYGTERPAELFNGALPDVDVERVHAVTIRTKPRSAAVIFGDITGIDPEGKRITVYASSGDASTQSWRNEKPGQYRLSDAPTGTVTVYASVVSGGASRSTRPVVVDVAPHAEVRADLHFDEPFAVDGRVLRNGTPVSGARIDFNDANGNGFNAVTGDGGAYRAEVTAGRYRISTGSYSIERTIAGPQTIDINIDLAPLTVTVVDAVTSLPLEQATVSGRDTGASTHAVITGTTGLDGRVTLDLPRNVNAIAVEKEGFATAAATVETPAMVIKLTRSDGAVVRIVDARDGRPLTGYAIARDAEGRVVAAANEAGMDGSMRFALAPGRYRFSASAEGYGSHTVAADVPPAEVRIPLRRGGKLLLQSRSDIHATARLLQPDGEEYVRCWCNGIAEIRIDGRTTLIESAAPGPYTLEIRQTGAKPRSLPVSVTEGETSTVAIDP